VRGRAPSTHCERVALLRSVTMLLGFSGQCASA
jgi:hypothetical protein